MLVSKLNEFFNLPARRTKRCVTLLGDDLLLTRRLLSFPCDCLWGRCRSPDCERGPDQRPCPGGEGEEEELECDLNMCENSILAINTII